MLGEYGLRFWGPVTLMRSGEDKQNQTKKGGRRVLGTEMCQESTVYAFGALLLFYSGEDKQKQVLGEYWGQKCVRRVPFTLLGPC